MEKRTISGIMLTLLLIGILGITFNVTSIEASPEMPKWAIKTIISETGQGSWSIRACMVLDSNNKPHVVFQDLDDLWTYARIQVDPLVGSEWTTPISEHVGSEQHGTHPSFVLAAYDRPHFVYVDGSGRVKYAFRSAEGWIIEVVDEYGYSTSIALDSDGNPHITYAGKYAYRKSTWAIIDFLLTVLEVDVLLL